MNPLLFVILVCLTFSTGTVVFVRSLHTPAPLPDKRVDVLDGREKIGYQLSNIINTKGGGLDHELGLMNKSRNTLLYEQSLIAVAALVFSIVFSFLFLGDSWLLTFIVITGITCLGWVLPRKKLVQDAEEKKSSMRQTLVIYQELASTAVAGGQSVQSALRNAANYGNGEQWAQLRSAAVSSMTSTEVTFASRVKELAEVYKLAELDNLAGLIEVADEGGTSKASLRDLARQQSRKFAQQSLDESESNTSRLIIPTALIFLSFVLLLGFAVIDGLSQVTL